MVYEYEKEKVCKHSKYNQRYPSPGYCIPAPRECECCQKFEEIEDGNDKWKRQNQEG